MARVRVQGVLIGQLQLEDSILAYRPYETQRNASAIFLSGSFISTLPFGSLRQVYRLFTVWRLNKATKYLPEPIQP